MSRYSNAWLDELGKALQEDKPEKRTLKFYNQSIPATLVAIAIASGVSPDSIRGLAKELTPIALALAKKERRPWSGDLVAPAIATD